MVVQEHQNPHPPDYLDLGLIVGHSFVGISPRYHRRCAWGQYQLQNSSRLKFSDILTAVGLAAWQMPFWTSHWAVTLVLIA